MQAIILAGGLGTRLSTKLNGLPKPMVPIGESPFISLLLDKIINGGVKSVVLSVGYRYEKIKYYFGNAYRSVPIQYSIENKPLGTGGAIKKALQCVTGDSILVFNGDSYFDLDLNEFLKFHEVRNSSITIGIKKMKNADRYGTVLLDNDYRVIKFKEKNKTKNSYINCGVYALKKNLFDDFGSLKQKFSFEKDFLEKKDNISIYGFPSVGNFIDIGTPKDLSRAKFFFMSEI
tara:strand:- start:282 stop:977 length:696 start_codon:yes stop_codon:yes gene_type:complete